MTLQAKGFQWSMGIHGMLILLVAVLQSFAVSQTRVTVIDFTLSGNNAPPAVEQTSPSQAPAAKQEPKPAKAIRPKEVPKKAIAKEALSGAAPQTVGSGTSHDHPQRFRASAEAIPPTLPQAADGPGGPSAEGKGSSIPSPLGGDGAGEPSANGSSRDAADSDGLDTRRDGTFRQCRCRPIA